MGKLFLLSAAEALRAFRRRELSPVEYLEALIRRSEVAQPFVNAFGDTYFEEALDLARDAEARYAGRGDPPRRLEGLPVAVKDEAAIAGKRTTNASLVWADNIPERSEPMVERLLEAGAIVHARTLTPEFSIAFWTHSRMWGVTRNPWNPVFDVGGSSGGSAAALAAGMTPVATGSDIGGSIRVPASCCGVVGYMPPKGRIPMSPPFCIDGWCHLGPLARTVGDCALVADALVGPHPSDHRSLRPRVEVGEPVADVRGMRIALSLDLGEWPVTEPVRSAVRGVAEALRQEGAVVEEVDLTIGPELVRRASDAHYAPVMGEAIRRAVGDRWDEVNPYTTAWIRSLEGAESPLTGLEAEATITERLGEVLDRYETLLCPAMAIPALEAGVDYTERPVPVNGRELDSFHDICLTEVFNPAGCCPVIVVPAGRDPRDVPIGVQIVGRTYDDPTVFRVAATVERARPWPLVADLG